MLELGRKINILAFKKFKGAIQKYQSKIKVVFKSMYCRSSFEATPYLFC